MTVLQNIRNQIEGAKHVGVSYEDHPFNLRRAGKSYLIVSDLRSGRVKYITETLEVRSTEKSAFKIVDKKYLEGLKKEWLEWLDINSHKLD